MTAVNWWTVAISFASALLASWIGVRYFTGPRIRAEYAQAARREIRDFVSPMRRDLRIFRAGRGSGMKRSGTAQMDDGVQAQRLLQLTHDLPPLARRRMRRRLDVIYGTGWMNIARSRDVTTVQDEQVTSSHVMAAALLDNREGVAPVSYLDGLMHRAYRAGPTSPESAKLERQLLLLQQAL